jgi:multidrug efflux pump subunit AcrA (membrane-fusion protein)
VLAVGRDNKLESRAVTLGLENADRVEVKTGLAEGDIVVVGSRAQLKPGTIVSPKIVAQAGAGEH